MDNFQNKSCILWITSIDGANKRRKITTSQHGTPNRVNGLEIQMKIVQANFASIKNNAPDGDRVYLSIASHLNEDGHRRFFIITDTDEHTGPEEKTKQAAKANADAMWGGANSPWDLQYHE